MSPCVFFDRDGIINVSPGPGYVERVEDFHLVPEFVEALRVVSSKGYAAVVITNQRGVGRGIMTQETLDSIHDHLIEKLEAFGLKLHDIYVCVANDNEHPNRKPNPGMIFDAARDHNLDLSRSWMVGDNESDVLAGRRAGIRTILVNNSGTPTEADIRLASMSELAACLSDNLG